MFTKRWKIITKPIFTSINLVFPLVWKLVEEQEKVHRIFTIIHQGQLQSLRIKWVILFSPTHQPIIFDIKFYFSSAWAGCLPPFSMKISLLARQWLLKKSRRHSLKMQPFFRVLHQITLWHRHDPENIVIRLIFCVLEKISDKNT
jgi:hypothetical protein